MPRAPVKKRTEPRAPRFYPAYDAGERTGPKKAHVPAKLRGSIKPGTVLILLAGRFRGKRVVFLKQLKSGLLLVTGPFEVNGVPLRRCNQAYVIATSTKVDVSKVKVPDSIDDGYFSKDNDPEDAKQGDEEKFFATGKKGASVSEQRKKDQAAVDKALMGKLNDQLKAYLAAKFSLSKGQRPHEMKF